MHLLPLLPPPWELLIGGMLNWVGNFTAAGGALAAFANAVICCNIACWLAESWLMALVTANVVAAVDAAVILLCVVRAAI